MAIFKKSYQYSPALNPGLRGKTLEDLAKELRRDTSLNPTASAQLMREFGQVANRNGWGTPLSAFAAGGAGAVIANKSGRYFGMTPVGRALVTAIGFGIGSQIHDHFASGSTPGWSLS